MTVGPSGDGPGDEATAWLIRLRERGALLEGHFRLSSGLHSPHYVQCALLLQNPLDARDAAESLAARLLPRLEARPDAVVSPAVGGLVLGHELGHALGCRAMWAERGEDGGLRFRRGFRLSAGERVVVAEDVVTTAGSVRELMSLVATTGAEVIGVACLVDRSGGRISWEVPAVCLVRVEGVQVPPEECPLCAAGRAVEKPGSRPA